MKKVILTGIISFIVGILVTTLVMYFAMPGVMLLEDESKFASFEETVTEFEASIEEHEWKLVATHDLQKSMKKFGMDVKSVKVFELCHPDHAGRVLEADDERIVSSLMPCRVAIYEKDDGKIYISRMNSGLMAKPMKGVIPEVMALASEQNEEILEAILKN